MKVLHICTKDQKGGAELFAFDMTQCSSNQAYLVVKKKHSTSERVIQIKRSIIGVFADLLNKLSYKLFSRAILSDIAVIYPVNDTFKNLKKIDEYETSDIIHLHNIHGEYFDFDALEKIAREKPIIWTLHDMWPITAGETHTFDNDNYITGDPFSPFKNYYPLLNSFIDLRDKFFLRKKQLYNRVINEITFVPNSYWMEQCFKRAFLISKPQLFKTIRNSINTETFKNRNERNWSIPRLLLFHNKKNKLKGSELFINISDQISGAHELYVIGDHLELKHKKIQYKKDLSRKELNEIYNQTDILIFPSKAESFGLVVAEAMASGVFVIGSDVGGITELISEAGGGVLFKNNNSKDLLNKINNTLQIDLSELRKKADNCSKYIYKNFNSTKMFQDYNLLYTETIKNHKANKVQSKL